jgi:hypothetical protein
MVKNKKEVMQNIKHDLYEKSEWFFAIQFLPNKRTNEDISGFSQGLSL